ncbi:nicotinamide-nucleotide adenylyltransferase [Candidatus Woesearchaeota archaeon]|nr:nicotinamide-nucleotide adenylyltransferase [Candidatus Woesearchaeota archaeon]
MKTALFIGRFQPFHLGHLEYVKRILRKYDNLIIVIGSSQKKNTEKNPFSYEQRKEMIIGSLKESGIDIKKIKIQPLKDFPEDNEKWFNNLKKEVNRFDTYFAGENKLTKQILEKHGYNVNIIKKRIKGIFATRIRRRIKQGKEWKEDVPEFVYAYLKKTN